MLHSTQQTTELEQMFFISWSYDSLPQCDPRHRDRDSDWPPHSGWHMRNRGDTGTRTHATQLEWPTKATGHWL